jgi:pseudaminic acid cytidylyltransferase
MSNLCIIPARGGSKRIPRKNIKDFLGKPIIAYSILAAIESKLFDEVMVSTDDIEIAEIAFKYGALVPFLRSEINSTDFSNTVDVICEVIENYNNLGKTFTNICCLYPTAPLINFENIRSAYDLMINNKFSTVFPVTVFSFPILRALKVDEKQKVDMIWPENKTKRSQDLEQCYHDAGQFYWLKSHDIAINNQLYTENSGVIILSEMDVQDIDNDVDWTLAELKFQTKNNTKNASSNSY